jgi:biopolymer transport protein ExbD
MLKKKRRIGISIDMTPMVDVAFLLLIFFMTTTQFKPPDKDKITLPESNSEAKSPESDIITLAVTSPKPEYNNESRLRIIYRRGGEEVAQELTPDAVASELSGILKTARAANPAARMIVKMDKDATYGIMADMMKALQDAKAPRFNVQTELAGKAGMFSKAANAAAK